MSTEQVPGCPKGVWDIAEWEVHATRSTGVCHGSIARECKCRSGCHGMLRSHWMHWWNVGNVEGERKQVTIVEDDRQQWKMCGRVQETSRRVQYRLGCR